MSNKDSTLGSHLKKLSAISVAQSKKLDYNLIYNDGLMY